MKSNLNSYIKATLLGVIGFILMLLEFSTGLFPSFLMFDFSDITSVIAGFSLGPIFGVVAAFIRNVLHLFKTTTGGVGEFANFIVAVSFLLPASMLYCRNKTKKNAIIGLFLGVISMTLIGAFFNYFILIPFYSKIMPLETIIKIAQVSIPAIKSTFDFVLYAVIPFNIIKSVIISIIIVLIYKKISFLL